MGGDWYHGADSMTLPDLILLAFIAAALVFRGRRTWKRTAAYVLVGTLIGDLTGALFIAILYHWHPGVLDWVRYFIPAGALGGGICDWLGVSKTLNKIGQQQS